MKRSTLVRPRGGIALAIAAGFLALPVAVTLPPMGTVHAQQTEFVPVPRPRPTAEMMAIGAALREPGGDIDVPPELVAGGPARLQPPAGLIAPPVGPGAITAAAFSGLPLQLTPMPTAVDPQGKIEDRLPLAFGPGEALGGLGLGAGDLGANGLAAGVGAAGLGGAAPLDLTRGMALDLAPIGGPLFPAANANAPLNLVNPAFSAEQPKLEFRLAARLTDAGAVIPDGIAWRVFAEQPGPDGKLPLIAEIEGGEVDISVPAGVYLVHAAFGSAGATKRVEVSGPGLGDELVLNAGGLQLHALVGRDIPLPAGEVAFDIFADDEDAFGERTLLLPDVAPDALVRLNAGTYHVVSRYGATNAMVRADIEIRPGSLTEATIYHQAARVTLRLVSGAGRDALPNTAWSVVTPGGDSVFDSVGAFPSVVLAAGEYTAVAKHDGDIFEGRFRVESGANRDIEVIAQNPVVAGVTPVP